MDQSGKTTEEQTIMRKIRAALVTLALTGAALIAAPATAPAAEDCTTVWLTNPTINNVLPAGTKRCLDLDAGAIIPVYRLDDPGLRQIDWLDSWAYTRQRPNGGRVQSTADAIRSVADRYDVAVQFAWRDLLNRRGCYNGFANSVTGAAMPSPRHPGEGLVRIGTGTIDRCMTYKQTAMNVAKYEISHILIERICREMEPPIMQNGRADYITSAYAQKYLGATMSAGGIQPTSSDFWRATKVHNGWCGG
jgi:hypothetical protein